jgi:tetratricopeptide (TPR) repeat protein
VQQATGHPAEAAENLTAALKLYRDLNDRAGVADTLNYLGETLLASAEAERARACHEEALKIATDIGAPIIEAHALEGIGRAYLNDGQPSRAAPPLRQALAIYQRFGSPHAPQVEAILRDYDL